MKYHPFVTRNEREWPNNRRDRKQPGWGQKLWLLMNISMIGTYHIYIYIIFIFVVIILLLLLLLISIIISLLLTLIKKILSMIIPLNSIGFWGVKIVKSSMIFHWRISPLFAVNCTINLIEANLEMISIAKHNSSEVAIDPDFCWWQITIWVCLIIGLYLPNCHYNHYSRDNEW